VIDQKHRGAAAFEQHSEYPQIRAMRFRRAQRLQIAQPNGHQEQAVELGKQNWIRW